jgi:hypothetical protein
MYAPRENSLHSHVIRFPEVAARSKTVGRRVGSATILGIYSSMFYLTFSNHANTSTKHPNHIATLKSIALKSKRFRPNGVERK